MNCRFTRHETLDTRASFRCTRCGYITVPIPDRGQKIHRHCRRGWGDRFAWLLSLFGITKARVSLVLGRPCDCDKRQEALNEIGEKLGG